MAEHCLCGHDELTATSLHDSNGLPVYRCKKCGLDVTDEDLTLDATRYAAANAGLDDEGWVSRYATMISSLGFVIVPWPVDLQIPHAAVPADHRIKPTSHGVDMLVVDGPVFRAMARALEGAM